MNYSVSIRITALLSLLAFFSCTPKVSKKLSTDDGKIEIAIIQLNDVYEISGVDGGKKGNLARVAKYAEEIRQKYPNNLMTMAGDFLNPSLINTMKYEGERVRGKQMIEVLNAMKMDIVAFGNHEFDFDLDDLQKRINESNFTWIATNLVRVEGKDSTAFYKEREGKRSYIKPTVKYTFIDTDGTKASLGLFSATINSNPKEYVHYLDADSCASLAIDKLNKENDLVLGLTHLSMEEDIALATAEPSIDLIMGGHEHDHRFKEVGKVKIAKADANAKTLYLHILQYNTRTKELNITSELIEINEQLEKDVKVAEVIKKWDDILNKEIRQVVADPFKVVYRSRQVLDGRESSIRHTQGRMGELMTKAMMAACKKYPEVALLNSGSIRIDDQLEGDILGIDIFRTLPFGGSIVEVEIKGSLLSGIMRYSENHTGTGAYLQYSGLQKKGKTWMVNGAPIDHDKYYHVVMNDFLLMGFDIPFLKEDNKGLRNISKPKKGNKKDLRVDIRGVIINYLEKLK